MSAVSSIFLREKSIIGNIEGGIKKQLIEKYKRYRRQTYVAIRMEKGLTNKFRKKETNKAVLMSSLVFIYYSLYIAHVNK